jgi:hypothetical protein
MLGGWWFGGSPASPDSNFLRVHNAFPPNRRLSDNQLIGPPKIRIAPSCNSSPGGTPGSGGGLPIRRHSSIGPQERRGSAINLSPPTVRFFSTTLNQPLYRPVTQLTFFILLEIHLLTDQFILNHRYIQFSIVLFQPNGTHWLHRRSHT